TEDRRRTLLCVSVNSAVSLQKRIIGGHDCADTERHYYVRLVKLPKMVLIGGFINPVLYTDNGQKNDIMLLKLPTPVTGVPLVPLPDCSNLPDAAIATRLQCVNMKVVEVSHFLPAYGHTFSAGDAGSAVVFNGMIYGVISAGVSEHPCQRPASIIDVCGYIQWIRGVTRP
uniref:Peptidase S1 domain-containing protein n=1 Tax=Poecilia mexicana TaxID=48701 RepID=A0A3B3X2K6_9TELE